MNQNSSTNRLKLIQLHLNANKTASHNYKSNKSPFTKWREKAEFDKSIIEQLYYPITIEFRDLAYKIMCSHPEFKHYYMYDMSIDQIRELCVLQIQVLLRELNKTISFKELRNDPMKFYSFLDAVSSFDPGLSVKMGVHAVLYYNSLINLGTEKHQKFVERCLNYDDLGCFALTELSHGSNVREIQTTATYDEQNQEFKLNSPSYDSYKWWIGGAGKTANMCIVFAQLYVKQVCYGVHSFIVGIRNIRDNMPFPGVTIGDAGPKLGNDNIDNGFIGFKNYRIPLESLLDKYSQVSQEGVFSTIIENPDIRFATALGALEEGRITIALAGQNILRNAICIAARFSVLRKQFGTKDKVENPIINYPMTQIRIIPALADNFAYRIAGVTLGQRWVEILPFISNPKDDKVTETHAILSVIKPISSNNSQFHLQRLREVMGGHGYSRFNMIGHYRNCNDINLTWEGDNSVLIQQCAKFILDNFQKKMKGRQINMKSLSFLSKFDTFLEMKLNIMKQDDLYNVENLLVFFEYRTLFFLVKSLGKLSAQVEDKMVLFDAWNNSQVFGLNNLARSYGELYVFNCFNEKLKNLSDSPSKALIKSMMVLFSLSSFERDLAVYLENSFISGESCDLIKNEILKICLMLKDQLIPIVDTIAPPDEILGAPFGSSDGQIIDKYLNHVFDAKGCFERPNWWEKIHLKKI